MGKDLCESEVDLEREKEKQPEFKILRGASLYNIMALCSKSDMCMCAWFARLNAKNKNK